jgi:hypothetical protein
VFLKDVGEADEQPAALGGARVPPRLEGLVGNGNRLVDLGGSGERNRRSEIVRANYNVAACYVT